MKFYRLATEEDFNKRFEVAINHFEDHLPVEVEVLIEEDSFLKAVNKLREMRGISIQDSKRYCKGYESFVKAKRDFLSGKPVYTDY